MTVASMSVLTKMIKDEKQNMENDYDEKSLAIIFVRTLMDATITVAFSNHKKHINVFEINQM
jgi:hypothetical protein